MAWPAVTAGQNILASQFNALASAIALWGGPVNGGGYALTNVASLAVTGNVTAANLGTASSRAATDFDAAGAAAAAVAAIPALTKATQVSSTVYKDQANTYTAGAKQTHAASATTAGAAFSGVSADPSGLALGDLWFRSDLLQLSYYTGAATKRLATADQIPTLASLGGASLTASNAFTGATETFTGNLAIAGTTVRQQLSVGANLDLYSGAYVLATQPNIRAGGAGVLYLNAVGSNALWLNSDGGAGVIFGTGTSGVPSGASVSAVGLGTFVGLASSAAITGPLGGWIPMGLLAANVYCTGTMTATPVTISTQQYIRVGPIVFFQLIIAATLNAPLSNTVYVSGFPAANINTLTSITAIETPGITSLFAEFSAATVIELLIPGGVAWASGAHSLRVSGFYRAA